MTKQQADRRHWIDETASGVAKGMGLMQGLELEGSLAAPGTTMVSIIPPGQ